MNFGLKILKKIFVLNDFKLAKKLSAVNAFHLFLQNEKNKIFYHEKKAKKK